MNAKDLHSRSDDIVQLKSHLGAQDLAYQDITRQLELERVCQRWPLLAETAQRLGRAATQPSPADTAPTEPLRTAQPDTTEEPS